MTRRTVRLGAMAGVGSSEQSELTPAPWRSVLPHTLRDRPPPSATLSARPARCLAFLRPDGDQDAPRGALTPTDHGASAWAPLATAWEWRLGQVVSVHPAPQPPLLTIQP